MNKVISADGTPIAFDRSGDGQLVVLVCGASTDRRANAQLAEPGAHARLRRQIRTTGGRIGLLFLLVSALGMTIAAIFTSDPITASQDELTTHGSLHGLGALLSIPSFPITAALISWSLARNRVWSLARRALLWAATLTWIGLLVFVLSVALLLPRGNGEFGPDVLIGWPNRLLVLAYSLWLMVVACGRRSGCAAIVDPPRKLTLMATAGTYIEANGQQTGHERPE